MNKTKKIIVFCLILVFLLVIQEIIVFKFDRKDSLIMQARKKWIYSSSINKGERFYIPENVGKLEVDEYFLLKEINRKKHLIDINQLEEKYSQDPLKRMWNKENPVEGIKFYWQDINESRGQPINNSFYWLNKPFSDYLEDPYDDVLFRSLYCDKGRYYDYDFDILKNLEKGDGGYSDTHLLLSLLFLKENGCYEKNKIDKKISDVAKKIINAEENDRIFSDLYAERIVFLYWAGYGDYVQKKWTDAVANNLTNDPGWRDKNSFSSNAHTTGLSLLALIYYREGENKQLFYR